MVAEKPPSHFTSGFNIDIMKKTKSLSMSIKHFFLRLCVCVRVCVSERESANENVSVCRKALG